MMDLVSICFNVLKPQLSEEVAVPVSQRQALDRCLARPSKGGLLGRDGGRCHQVPGDSKVFCHIFPMSSPCFSHSIPIGPRL